MRVDAPALEGVVKLHLATSKVFNVLLDGTSLVRLEPVQDAGEPALEACTHRSQLPFDRSLGELVRRNPKLMGSLLQMPERLFVAKVELEDGCATHGVRVHPLRTPVEDEVWSKLQRLPGTARGKDL